MYTTVTRGFTSIFVVYLWARLHLDKYVQPFMQQTSMILLFKKNLCLFSWCTMSKFKVKFHLYRLSHLVVTRKHVDRETKLLSHNYCDVTFELREGTKNKIYLLIGY